MSSITAFLPNRRRRGAVAGGISGTRPELAQRRRRAGRLGARMPRRARTRSRDHDRDPVHGGDLRSEEWKSRA